MIVDNLMEFDPLVIFIRVRRWIRDDVHLYLKAEMFNPGGSIKFKPAVAMIRALEASGELRPGRGLIDTSSGNMGVALAQIACHRRYNFICVCDEKLSAHNRAVIGAYGAQLVVLPGSTLQDRYAYIADRIGREPSLVWTRQFTNPLNPQVHEATTGQEILREFPHFQYLFVGAGTAGTLVGSARAVRAVRRNVKIVAVDAEGSAHFERQSNAARRRLPGIGASERSPFLADAAIDEYVLVPERTSVAACHELVRQSGWLLGASTGSVLAAIRTYERRFSPGDTVIGIAADSGERYLDGLYNPAWLQETFPVEHAQAQ